MKNHKFLRSLQVVTLCLFAAQASNLSLQAASAPAKSNSASTDTPKSVAYRISPTDKISINVIGEPDLYVANKRIDANGNVNLALLTDVVHLAGLTVSEAQAAIENAYKEGRILRTPQVSINIEEYAPREVSISGMIKQGGKYNLPPETITTIKDIVLRAGGFMDTANGSKVRVSRTSADGTTKVFTLDIDAVIRSKDAGNSTAGSFVVEPGDTIYVPEKII